MSEVLTKVCTMCGEEKRLDDFYDFKMRGIVYKRNQCKPCFNNAKNKNKNQDYKPRPRTIREELPAEYKIERTYSNMFNETEIKILKNLISKNNEIMSILNNKIELSREDNEDNKTKKSISISTKIHNKILELSKNSNLNYSQVIESLLKKALENI